MSDEDESDEDSGDSNPEVTQRHSAGDSVASHRSIAEEAPMSLPLPAQPLDFRNLPTPRSTTDARLLIGAVPVPTSGDEVDSDYEMRVS